MAPTKMACKNNDKFSYTGKEMSPLGLGFCADAETVGTAMMGRDNKNWLVGVKNGEKIWIRAPEKVVLAKEEPVLTSDNEVAAEEVVPVVEEKPKKEKKAKKTVKTSDSEEEKPAPTEEEKPKKEKKPSTRKAPAESATEFEEGTEKEGAEGVVYVVKADKNGTKKWMKKTEEKPKKEKKAKAVVEEQPSEEETEKPVVEEKPKRKYTRKPKATENDDAVPKKERKKRGPTAYNLFIGSKLKELRAKTPGKETTVYMREALDIWAALTKEEKEAITEQALNEVDA